MKIFIQNVKTNYPIVSKGHMMVSARMIRKRKMDVKKVVVSVLNTENVKTLKIAVIRRVAWSTASHGKIKAT